MSRPVGFVVGGMAAGQALCACAAPVAGLFDAEPYPPDRGAFLAMMVSALISLVAGGALWWFGRPAAGHNLGRREAVLAVALIWVGAGVFGGIPFVIDAGFSPADAYFEAISGFTTTGATIIEKIEGEISRPLLLWRSLIQWLGGMGIVVLFVAVFPSVGVGGKHMFRSEVPGPTAEGLQPRIADTSVVLWRIYAAFTAVLVALLWILGMSPFDAVCHAMTTMSTGGFSTHSGSIGAWDNAAIEMVISLFMLIAGVNFALYFGVIRQRTLRVFLRSTEFRVYLAIVIVAIVALTFAIWPVHHNFFTAARKAIFMVGTTITSTGYGTDDYMAYPGFGLGLVLLMMFVGGSAGSTAGGIKVARMALLGKVTWGRLRISFRPSVVHVVRMGRKAVPSSVVADVTAFFVVFMLCLGAGTVVITLTDGVPVQSAFGAMLSCLSNMGPAPFWDEAFEADNFAGYTAIAKGIFSIAMILGRLEFFTLLALLLPDFWRA